MSPLDKLLSLSSDAISKAKPSLSGFAHDQNCRTGTNELSRVLSKKNGFWCFEKALHVYAADPAVSQNIVDWNRAEGWRSAYANLAKNALFFAQDIFGFQFYILEKNVFQFDTETGESELLGASIEDWASLILSDYAFYSGYPIAHEWQTKHGAIQGINRLMAKTPFFLGGEFNVNNLYEMSPYKMAELRASIYLQTKDLSEGEQVKIVYKD
jgi:hypothetical protein